MDIYKARAWFSQSVCGAPPTTVHKADFFYYIYGLLHSPEYREWFKDNLRKELPCMPAVVAFRSAKVAMACPFAERKATD